MKLLVFHIGADRYGLPLATIRQVLPLMALTGVPLAPDAVAGLMNLHGASVPVIDLARSSGAPAAARQVDTRILLVDYPGPDGAVHALGLLAERVIGVQDVSEASLHASGVRAAPFLGPMARDAQGFVQLVQPEHLLPADLRAALFPPDGAT
ncbi:chemotaxis protein CheW [Pseudoduganella plicata]|uniref:Chew domain protein n=1 Tax=Pseudoduganella plicata TaxID=321984 RepID=A0A4P7BJ14_9BURK|nr:chemotaxis protein CheW [Pseudoduganella plicata]QBQ38874.1 purine-binding chemotaxis protein CheW [Pseudoduganella plicata]GGZ09570.1 chew domain protein [Pseudoduganella plicata]